MISLSSFLILGAMLFCIGIFGVLTRRNVVGILISIELVLNAANINLVAFNQYIGSPDDLGQIFSLFVIAIAASEVAIGLAIAVLLFRQKGSVDTNTVRFLKW